MPGAPSIHDTIAAVSSPPGTGLRGIVRLSGPAAWPLALALVTGNAPPLPRRALACRLRPTGLPALLVLFRGPASYTGLDGAELHVPGTPALLHAVLAQALAAGARQAEPGEFTAQAFLHGKMDLTQAEGIAATIAAGNARQLAAAAQLRGGALHAWSTAFSDDLADLLALLEAAIDFSDEPGVSFISAAELRARLARLHTRLAELRTHAVTWERLDAAPSIVFTGRANVGKSSLVNALARQERALVSAVPGTTRDVLGVTVPSARGPVRLLDVAGTEAGDAELPAQMNAARQRALAEADLIVLVIDEQESAATLDAQRREIASCAEFAPDQVVIVRNKDDLPDANRDCPCAAQRVTARRGRGLDALWELLVKRLHEHETGSAAHLVLNQRHRARLAEANGALLRACEQASRDSVMDFPELLAADLRDALKAIGEISGSISPDDVLGRIFGMFCVGK